MKQPLFRDHGPASEEEEGHESRDEVHGTNGRHVVPST